jgi:hypothetical protein
MLKCDRCESDAQFKATKLYHLFPIKTVYLCEDHRRAFERWQDIALMIGVTLSLALSIFSIHHQLLERGTRTRQEIAAQQQTYAAKDLDHDGRVSWFEEQITPEQLANYKAVGYPFNRVLQTGDPTKSVRKKIEVAAFVEAILAPLDAVAPLAGKFNHPLLIRSFVQQRAAPDASPQLRGVYLTHDDYLALQLTAPDDEERSLICLEKLTPEQQAALDALAPEPKVKAPKTPKKPK